MSTDAPALPVLLDPALLKRRLAALAEGWGIGTVQSACARLVSAHPGSRYTFAIRIETARATHEAIGKAYAADRSDVHAAMERLWRAGFDDGAEHSIPRPLAAIAPLRLLLQEKVDGTPAQDWLLGGCEEDRRTAARRCARWLARFHAAAPAAGPAYSAAAHFAAMERWRQRISKHLGEGAGAKAACLLRGLELQARGLRAADARAGHGSFSPSQILFANGRTVTFDWDGFDTADPARDVARYRVALRRLALGRLGSIRGLDGAADDFLVEYQAAGGADVSGGLRFFEAAVCLQIAKYNIAHPVTHWREKLGAMLEEGLRVLEGRA